MNPTQPKVYVLDTHSIIFQMFHAIPHMSSPNGRPTNAVFGVVRDLMNIFEQVKPEYFLCAFDLSGPTFRDELSPSYKKNRTPPPDELVAQIPMIEEVLKCMNIPHLAKEGYEADDVMATIARIGEEQGYQVVLCTTDKDCRQLITDHVSLYNLRKKLFFDAQTLKEEWGITPQQVIDYQSLVGDSADNVKGVKGIGEKTAAKLLNDFGSIDNILVRLNEVKPQRIQDAIRESYQSGELELARKLVTLNRNVPLTIDWEGWYRRAWNYEKLYELFVEFGFKTHANRVKSIMRELGQNRNANALFVAGETPISSQPVTLFPESLNDPQGIQAEEWGHPTYHLINTPEKFTGFFNQLCQQREFVFDLETTGLDPLQCELVGLAFCWSAKEAYYLPVKGPSSEPILNQSIILEQLKPIFENPEIKKANHNIKYDWIVLKNHNIEVNGIHGDSMLAHYLLNSGERTHGLDELTLKYFKHENISIEQLIGKGKKQITMDMVSTAQVCDYAAEDADAAWRLKQRLEPELDKHQLRKVYDEIEIPLITILAEMQYHGIRIDVDYLKQLSVQMQNQIDQIEKEIHKCAGHTFNIASLKELRTVLFDEMKLPVYKRTTTTNEPSTDQETLEILASEGHEVPAKLITHRQISKLKNTYVDALPALINPKTMRIHSSFNQTIASTGRLSSSEPNLQNIPARSDMGREIRQAFLPEKGWKLVTADYSQIELRMLAHLSKDPHLVEAYIQKQDIHNQVAAQVFNVKPDQVTKDMRRVAKTINFGVIYGMSATGLAQRLSIKQTEAKKFIDDYFARFPKVLEYQQALLKKTRALGYVTSIMGRKRSFDPSQIRPHSSYENRNGIEREIINMEIQASAADLIKLAMIRISQKLKENSFRAKLLLSVHDELVLEAPPQEAIVITRLIKDEMINAMKLDVPIEVAVSTGPNWLEMTELK
ncbi:MAG: DNA polymerase I [Gemmataceae bacterium]|nr:DNA polymerase I [Gemmataceae bacterium]